MARKRNRISLNFEGFEELYYKLDSLQGDLKKVTEEALIKSHQVVTPKIEKCMSKLPAKGKYSTGETKASIRKVEKVEWEGMKAYIPVGFEFEKSGMKSIFLIYGTPRMKPVSGLKSAIYGSKTQKEVGAVQEEVLQKAIRELMGD